jgi:hypothetical protein
MKKKTGIKQVLNKDWMDKKAHGKQPKQRLTKKRKPIPKKAY